MISQAISNSLTDHLPDEIYSIDGMSSRKVRNLLNNICKEGFYLEVGAWKGSTLISALYGNNIKKAFVIENWSQFGDAREEFYSNIIEFIPKQKILIIEKDCYQIDLQEIDEKIDIFFYDGSHDYESQLNALKYFYSILADEFIFIVDDYNEIEVSRGTSDSINDLKLKIKYMSVLPSRYNCDKENYWNGIGVFKLRK
jgi:hypothetical protein